MSRYQVRILVTTRRGLHKDRYSGESSMTEVFSPQDKAVLRALHHLGFSEVEEIRIGRYLDFVADAESEQALREKISADKKQLFNPSLEDFTIVSVLELTPSL